MSVSRFNPDKWCVVYERDGEIDVVTNIPSHAAAKVYGERLSEWEARVIHILSVGELVAGCQIACETRQTRTERAQR